MAISHADHDHPATPQARAACRKQMRADNFPIMTNAEVVTKMGPVKATGTVRLVGVEPRGRRRATVNGAEPIRERRRFIRDEGDMADVPHVFSAAIRHAWHQEGWTVRYGNPYNATEKRILIDNGHGDELELIYKAGQHHVNAVNYLPVKVDGERRRGYRVGEAPVVASGLAMLKARARVEGPINNAVVVM